jgi:hypothetical protein
LLLGRRAAIYCDQREDLLREQCLQLRANLLHDLVDAILCVSREDMLREIHLQLRPGLLHERVNVILCD